MILEFSAENFECIKDKITLSFLTKKKTDLDEYYIIEPIRNLKILKLALIYGANASGKTTILRALNFLKKIMIHSFNDKSQQFDFEPFILDGNIKNTKFHIEFFHNEKRFYYEVELNKTAIVKESMYYSKIKKTKVFERNTNLDTQFTNILFGSNIKMKKSAIDALSNNTLINDTVLAAYNKTNIESPILQEVFEWFKNVLKPIIYPQTNLTDYIIKKIKNDELNKREVVEILRKADFSITDFAINEEKIEFSNLPPLLKELIIKADNNEKDIKNITNLNLEFEHTYKNKKFVLDYEKESAGTKRYYQLAGIVAEMIKYPSIFPIDELESSLHPDLFKHLLLTFLVNSKNSQLIATTHNRDFFTEKDILHLNSIWFCEKSPNFGTELYSLADFSSSEVRKTKSIYKMYKIGKLGAVPNLSNYYLDFSDEN